MTWGNVQLIFTAVRPRSISRFQVRQVSRRAFPKRLKFSVAALRSVE